MRRFGPQPVGSVVGHQEGLCKPFRLVVNASEGNRVDVPGIGLRLRVFFRIAIDLRGGSEKNPGLLRLGEAQGFVRANEPTFNV